MADDFFTNDPFQDIVNQMFGGRTGRRSRVIRREEEEGDTEEFLETDEAYYLILETPGFEEDDAFIKIKGKELEIKLTKKNLEGIKHYLVAKLEQGLTLTKTLPEDANTKNFEYTLRNGMLEVRIPKR
ncbi:Hsp20/alpha crystallin family protein [Candidatus Pacearchaeota archaeon]|nr:Hsp20/alpha crystallin family protein [Candidatus Pacearchaeota archaeon]